jgi:hypothetical protein
LSAPHLVTTVIGSPTAAGWSIQSHASRDRGIAWDIGPLHRRSELGYPGALQRLSLRRHKAVMSITSSSSRLPKAMHNSISLRGLRMLLRHKTEGVNDLPVPAMRDILKMLNDRSTGD